jgi:hypothetical protein
MSAVRFKLLPFNLQANISEAFTGEEACRFPAADTIVMMAKRKKTVRNIIT